MKLAWPILLLFLASDDFDSGLKAYAEGRYDDALAAFRAAEASAGADASAELLYNLALAALRAGALADAETAAQRAAGLGGPDFEALNYFIRGNTAFARSRRAALVASQAESEPFAWDVAIAHAETARDLWQKAVQGRSDWPEARRNAERALLQIADLEEKRAAAEEANKKESDPPPPPEREEQPQDPQREDPEEIETDPEEQVEPPPLTAEELKKLIEKLREKEQEKRDVRKKRRREQRDVEKDW